MTYLMGRLLQIPLTLLLVSMGVFFALRVTGDPVSLYLPFEAPEDQRLAMRRQLGLDEPVLVQFIRFLDRARVGDLGYSIRHNRPAVEVALEYLPATFELAMASFLIAALVGGGVGIWAVLDQGGWVDRTVLAQAFVVQSIPGFWIAILAVFFFGAYLRWLPTSGAETWKHLVLPAVTTAWVIWPRITLLVRASLLQTLAEDYVRTARAKGLRDGLIMGKHVLANGLIPILTYLGLLLGRLLGGTVITETVFGWPGLGRLAVEAAFRRDMGMVQATAMAFAVATLVLNLLVDLVNAIVDPRIRT